MSGSGATLFFKWFFVQAPQNILRGGRNFLLWDWQFFSIGYLTPRLFAPWHRDQYSYGRGFDFSRFLRVWGWNLISRLVGAVLRIFVIFTGALLFLLIAATTVGIFVVWFTLPILSIGLFVLGLFTLFL